MATFKYKGKPIRLDAMQITMANANDVAVWCGGRITGQGDSSTLVVSVPTWDGVFQARLSWYVYKMTDSGELRTDPPEVFEAKYDLIP